MENLIDDLIDEDGDAMIKKVFSHEKSSFFSFRRESPLCQA